MHEITKKRVYREKVLLQAAGKWIGVDKVTMKGL